MRQERNYNIHNILKFKIIRNDKCGPGDSLDLDFLFFEVEKVDNPDIVINIGEFTPSNGNCYVVDHKYYVKENYFYCKDSLGRTRWEVEIFGFEDGNTLVNFNFKILGIQALIPCLPVQNFLLEALISYKLSKKNYYLIHSAAISKNNQASLLVGRGGAFKTALSMDFIRRAGFDFLGDDKVILHKNNILSYPTNFIRFNFRYVHGDSPSKKGHKMLDRIRLLKYIWENHSHKDNLMVNVVDSSILKSLFFITKKDQQKLVIGENLDPKKVADKLVINNKIETSLHGSSMPRLTGLTSNHFFKYMVVYSSVFPNSLMATYWRDLKRNFLEILEGIPTFEIEVPYKYDLNLFNEIYKLTK